MARSLFFASSSVAARADELSLPDKGAGAADSSSSNFCKTRGFEASSAPKAVEASPGLKPRGGAGDEPSEKPSFGAFGARAVCDGGYNETYDGDEHLPPPASRASVFSQDHPSCPASASLPSPMKQQ